MNENNTADQSGADERAKFIDEVERLAFSIPYQNSVTPQLVMLCVKARAALASTQPAPQAAQEPVGEAGTMPGTTGFTMACFNAADVPIGTKLYSTPQPFPAPAVQSGDRNKLVDEALAKVADMGTIGAMKWLGAQYSNSSPTQAIAQTAPVIVPQVVQAPSNESVKTATKVFQSIFFNAGLDGESAYEQMQRAMRAAIISSEYVAAPIVATVPSEPIQVYLVATKKGYMIEGSVPSNTSLKLGFNTLYAAPSPTEQASDVQYSQMIGLLQTICQSENYGSRCANADLLGDMIRRFSAPAAKGNAPDEVSK